MMFTNGQLLLLRMIANSGDKFHRPSFMPTNLQNELIEHGLIRCYANVNELIQSEIEGRSLSWRQMMFEITADGRKVLEGINDSKHNEN